ncbi:nuclear transport factor 2 family protein [Streptosporangium sp. G11]|uniref:nuclear transport factor 2 family protein n=1 Tax=Streptosporangium sp. G11 TaxID=3436926 RepID=UPI003EC0822E
MTIDTDLAARVRRLEDRALISERVITYAVSVDRRDWALFEDCFTEQVRVDFGGTTAHLGRGELVAFVRAALDGFTVTQHLSPNHVIEFDDDDEDRAVCHSYMYAQHRLDGSENGEFYLLRGSYTSFMRRTADGGWRIEEMIQHRSWEEGNTGAVDEARARVLDSA